MLLSFGEGFLLGLGAAVPLGPINILIMNEAIKKYSNGVLIGLGAMSADLVYLCLIFFGLTTFLNQTEVLNVLSVFGGVFLIYLSYSIFKSKDTVIKLPKENIKHPKKSIIYMKGFLLTLSNPYTIGFWLSVSSYVVSKELNMFMTLFGMLSAILSWILLMPYLVHKTKHKISQKISYIFSVVSSLILFGFGMAIFIKLIVL